MVTEFVVYARYNLDSGRVKLGKPSAYGGTVLRNTSRGNWRLAYRLRIKLKTGAEYGRFKYPVYRNYSETLAHHAQKDSARTEGLRRLLRLHE